MERSLLYDGDYWMKRRPQSPRDRVSMYDIRTCREASQRARAAARGKRAGG